MSVAYDLLERAQVPAVFTSVRERIAGHGVHAADRVAVSGPDATLTYGELDDRADRLAAALQADGAGPGSCVAVLLSRSARYVLAAAAVMKTGAAYLPLDPATPADRIAYILGDAGTAAVLTDHDHAGTVPQGPWTVVDLDEPRSLTPAPQTPADPQLGPETVAYVIYTSGSTGRPKGVEITHGNLAHLVDWHNAAFDVTPADRASQVAGLGFDAAVWEILAAARGRRLAARRRRGDPPLPAAAAELAGRPPGHHRVRADAARRAAHGGRVAGAHRAAHAADRGRAAEPPSPARSPVHRGQQLRTDRVHRRRDLRDRGTRG